MSVEPRNLEPGYSMAAPRIPTRNGRFDWLRLVGGFCFLLAAMLAASMAFRPGPMTPAGIILLVGLAGLVFVGLVAFRDNGAAAVEAGDAELADLVGALNEPAAVCVADGLIVAANGAWREAVGGSRRLPKNGGGLFAALISARQGGRGEGLMRAARGERAAQVSLVGQDRFLVRLAEARAAGAAAPAAAPTQQMAAPDALDAFAVASPFGAALLDGADPFEAPVLEVNAALAAVLGDGAVAGATLGQLLKPESVADVRASQASGRSAPYEVVPAARPDRTAQLYLAAQGGRTVAYLVDVTDLKKLQGQFAQRNKMEAIGQLAGGVAHDFNNLLTAIQLRLDELLLRHPLGDPSFEGLSEIRQTAVRAADLVGQLLTFSRKATVQRVTVDLGELISNFQVLLRRLLREDVKLETDYGLNLPLVRADKRQLENAIMNLVVNARDAVHGAGGGTVRLRTARVTENEAFELGYAGAGMGEMAMIEVADDGPGIPPELKDTIFEPFFTTKAVGEGTGLGLATVYGIVKQSDGWIVVDSKPGHGAAFRIFLPAYTPPMLVEAPVLPRPRPVARDLSGAGRILFVEDEDAVRGIAAKLLRARGYEVIEAADGEEALVLAEEHAGQIDLMISDVIMPGIDGPTLLKKARGYLGSAPVMFISGYAESEFSDLLEGEPNVSFLPKPLDIKTLAERVKQQLSAA